MRTPFDSTSRGWNIACLLLALTLLALWLLSAIRA